MQADYTKYQLLPDEDFEGDETIDGEELTRNVVGALNSITEWERGERKLRTSELVNGQWIEGEETGLELEARRAAEDQSTLRYDPSVDALYIKLGTDAAHDTKEIEPGIMLDYDQAGNVIGVEVLDIMERLKRQAKKTEEAA